MQGSWDLNEGACDELSEIAKLVDQALQEIRTTSYLLHHPCWTKRVLREQHSGLWMVSPSAAE